MRDQKKFWSGDKPTICDRCKTKLITDFVDAATNFGWMLLCLQCHQGYGFGLGTGRGQHYIKCNDAPNSDRWMKKPEPIAEPTKYPKPIYTVRSDEIEFP